MTDTDLIMEQWVIYDHPLDLPLYYVARKWEARRSGIVATDDVYLSTNIDTIRNKLEAFGKVKLMRFPKDDPKIMEVWI